MTQPCDPDTTIWLLRHALEGPAEEVDLDLVFELVAQLVTDLQAWPHEPGQRPRLLASEKLRFSDPSGSVLRSCLWPTQPGWWTTEGR